MGAVSDELQSHQAFESGDLETLRALAGPEFPNGPAPGLATPLLEYAIYHSPLPFLRSLLALGADPGYESPTGFPSLLAALATDREERHQILALLLSCGADVGQRGLNDWTPLHYAAVRNDPLAIEILLAHGADPQARTGIDDGATPVEEAGRLGRREAVAALAKAGRPGGAGGGY